MKTTTTNRTEISEIFSSIQGEGPYLGKRQIFVRFGRCNMHCHYCDELEKMKAENFTKMTTEQIFSQIHNLELEQGAVHSISLTGGEPLFYTPFLESFLPELKKNNYKTYLETNGTLPKELEKVIKFCDIVAMDLKPSSSTEDRSFWTQQSQFLKIAIRKEVFVKLVVTPQTTKDDVAKCVELVDSINSDIPFIFQPMSEAFGISSDAMMLIQKEYFEIARKTLSDVRVIPQMHKIWGVR